MSDGEATAVMAGLRAALVADAGVAALVGNRIVDEPRESIALPFIRFGNLEPRSDDTDGAQGAIVQTGLVVHSRPETGRVEAARICEAVKAALHRQPEAVTAAGFTVTEIEVQTWVVERMSDGATYRGRLALEVHLDN